MSKRILRMDVEEVQTIRERITTNMEELNSEVDNTSQILTSFEGNPYMRGSVESLQLIKERVNKSYSRLKGTMAELTDLLNTATNQTTETEEKYRNKFEELAGDDFEADARGGAGIALPGGDTSFKSWMSYQALTNRQSGQWKLQQDSNVYTDENGLRRYGDDYLVALGSAYGTEMGTRYRVTLDNGRQITVMLGDSKNPADPSAVRNSSGHSVGHRHGNSTGVLEFIVDQKNLNGAARQSGSVGSIPGLDGNVTSIVPIGKANGNFGWG